MSGGTFDFNNIESRAVIKYFFPRKEPNEFHAILTEIMGERAPSYDTVKNWVAQSKICNFSTCVAPHSGRPKTDFIDQIHGLILEHSRIS